MVEYCARVWNTLTRICTRKYPRILTRLLFAASHGLVISFAFWPNGYITKCSRFKLAQAKINCKRRQTNVRSAMKQTHTTYIHSHANDIYIEREGQICSGNTKKRIRRKILRDNSDSRICVSVCHCVVMTGSTYFALAAGASFSSVYL